MPWTLLVRILGSLIVARRLRPRVLNFVAAVPDHVRRRMVRVLDGTRLAGHLLRMALFLTITVIVAVAAVTELVLGPPWLGAALTLLAVATMAVALMEMRWVCRAVGWCRGARLPQ